MTEAAPEASQGPWRERAFTPRAVMPVDEVLKGLESAVRVSLATANHPRVAFDEVRRAWRPFLRQALEQCGGDGLDVWLVGILQKSGRKPQDLLFVDLASAVVRLRSARDLAHFEEDALKTIERVRTAFDSLPARKLSLKQLEKELEGKLEVDELFAVASGTDDELARRLEEIDGTMGQLRDQIRTRPGTQPDGMYANFVRLKAEVRVIDAELQARNTGVARPTLLP
jgi:hypothetical protein